MVESHLVSQLAKLIERNYKEKGLIRYHLEQRTDQSKLIKKSLANGYLLWNFLFTCFSITGF